MGTHIKLPTFGECIAEILSSDAVIWTSTQVDDVIRQVVR